MDPEHRSSRIQRNKSSKYTVAREQELRKLTKVVSQPKEAQARPDARSSKAWNIGHQTRDVGRDLKDRRQGIADLKARLKEKSEAAHKGENLAINGPSEIGLRGGHESVRAYRSSQRASEDNIGRLDRKEQGYRKARAEQQVRTEELRRRGAELGNVVGGFGSREAQIENDSRS